MDADAQIDKFKEFFELQFYEILLDKAAKGEEHILVEFHELAIFEPKLADLLLDKPEDTIRAAEHAIKRFELGSDDFSVRVRFRGLPASSFIMISEVRSKHIDRFIEFKGIVSQKTDVRPQVTSAKFECPSCGNVIPVLQIDTKFKEPGSCSCGRKGKFHMLSKELVDAQKLVVEEDPGDMDGGEQPRRLNVFLKNDLVSPVSDKKTNPGSKVEIAGVLKEVPITLATGGKSTRYDLIVEAINIQPVQEEFSSLVISEEDEQKILEISRDKNVYENILESIAPTIYGHDRIKEALVLQLFGGTRKSQSDGVTRRGDMHILLIGDPGSGKSQLLKRLNHVAPKSRFVSGKGASGAGLTAAVVKDEFLKGYALEAGALVLANKGLVCIDELDKMSKEDASAMHEALEQQQINISKANIQATLKSQTTVLAAANPKFGRFDPYDVLAKQIDLPSTLINRFDLIFPVRDMPDKDKDDRLASFILKLHKGEDDKPVKLETDDIKLYVAYAKQKINPKLTEDALGEIKNYFVKMRNSGNTEDMVQSIPISARQLEGLVRMSEASARTRLSKTVTVMDAKRAIDLLHHCLTLIGYDSETNKFDIDRITTGITASQRGTIGLIKGLINELEEQVGKLIPIDDLVREAEIKGLSQDDVTEVLEKLKNKGDIFNPRNGYISKID